MAAQREAMRKLLELVGGPPSKCRGCQAAVYWIRHRDKPTPTPYTAAGLNHFIDCPAAAQFGKKARD